MAEQSAFELVCSKWQKTTICGLVKKFMRLVSATALDLTKKPTIN